MQSYRLSTAILCLTSCFPGEVRHSHHCKKWKWHFIITLHQRSVKYRAPQNPLQQPTCACFWLNCWTHTHCVTSWHNVGWPHSLVHLSVHLITGPPLYRWQQVHSEHLWQTWKWRLHGERLCKQQYHPTWPVWQKVIDGLERFILGWPNRPDLLASSTLLGTGTSQTACQTFRWCSGILLIWTKLGLTARVPLTWIQLKPMEHQLFVHLMTA